jgi:hypothetical protein
MDTSETLATHPGVQIRSFSKIISHTLDILKTEFLVLPDREGSSSQLKTKKLIIVREISCLFWE